MMRPALNQPLRQVAVSSVIGPLALVGRVAGRAILTGPQRLRQPNKERVGCHKPNVSLAGRQVIFKRY